MTEHNVQCFFAKQTKAFNIENTMAEVEGSSKYAQITSHIDKPQSLVSIDNAVLPPTEENLL